MLESTTISSRTRLRMKLSTCSTNSKSQKVDFLTKAMSKPGFDLFIGKLRMINIYSPTL